MTQFSFGSGMLYGVRSDVANSTPVKFGALQDIQIEFSFQTRELYGQNQFPITIARGQGKITGKAKFAQITGATFNNLFFGQSNTAGAQVAVTGETQTIPSSGPYTITLANSGFSGDLGVIYASSGAPLTKVASAPAAGQYAVIANVYTFAAADAGSAILVAYTYAAGSAGNKTALVNLPMGQGPTFQAVFTETFNGKLTTLQLNQCVGSKLTIATKTDNFTIPEFDFSAFGDSNQNIGTLSFSE